MGWIIDAVIDGFWVGLVERMSRGKPRWVWALWALSPLFLLGALVAALWLLLR